MKKEKAACQGGRIEDQFVTLMARNVTAKSRRFQGERHHHSRGKWW